MKKIIIALGCLCMLSAIRLAADNVADKASYAANLHRYILSHNSDLKPDRRKALEDLADKDSRFALPALQRPDIFNDHNVLVIALEYPAKDVQIEAAKHLKDVGTKEDISPIIIAFNKVDKEIILGGAADYNAHKFLSDALVRALAGILKYPLDKNAPLDDVTKATILDLARKSE